MADMSMIATAATAIKLAGDIAKGMITLRDAEMVRGKIIELQSAILDAQSSIFSANDERAALIKAVGDLEKKVADFEKWEREANKYQLAEIGPAMFAYIAKTNRNPATPFHALCANCYQNRKKSVLQHSYANYGMANFECHACNSKLSIDTAYQGFPFRNVPRWKDDIR